MQLGGIYVDELHQNHMNMWTCNLVFFPPVKRSFEDRENRPLADEELIELQTT